jgi:hypothetical protein
MVRVGMEESDDIESRATRLPIGGQELLRRDQVAIVSGVAALIRKTKGSIHTPIRTIISTQQHPASLLGIGVT